VLSAGLAECHLRRGRLGFPAGAPVGLLRFTPSGYLDVSTLLLMFCLASGCPWTIRCSCSAGSGRSFDLRGDTTAAVAMGLERTGRHRDHGGRLLAIVFIALGTSSVGLLKLLGGGHRGGPDPGRDPDPGAAAGQR